MTNRISQPLQQFDRKPALALASAVCLMNIQSQAVLNQAQCFDLSVLRETPDRELPAYCRAPWEPWKDVIS